MPAAEILSQGDEVVTGQIADTNAAWLSGRLIDLGFDVVRHTTVGDRLPDLVTVLREIAVRSDVCVCTGGLGPTDDDLTAAAVAEAFNRPLVRDPVALAQIEARFRQFGREMAPVNRKQADLPNGALRLDNDWGTAPGFSFGGDFKPRHPTTRCWFACLPGVPREMRAMFDERVLPELSARFPLRPARLVTLRTIGVGESDLQQAMSSLSLAGGEGSTTGVVIGYRTKLPENHLKLRFSADLDEAAVRRHVNAVLERIGRWVYTIEGLAEVDGFDCGGGPPAEIVGRRLTALGQTLAVAESCTGGRLAAECTAVPGASAWFHEGVVTYANEAKIRLLGVSEADLAAHGAVSEPVARQMAEGVRARAGNTWGIGITGVAGPSGGTPDKPVGTVHVALSSADGTRHRALRLPGDRERVQSLSVAAALELLRRSLP
jgi:nicotinamide-nucleotide amidase